MSHQADSQAKSPADAPVNPNPNARSHAQHMDSQSNSSRDVTPYIPTDESDGADSLIPSPSEATADRDEAVRVGLEDQSRNAGAEVEGDRMAAGGSVTGGDVDAMQEQAKVVGEEAVGGTTPVPDQDNVEDIAASVGIDVPLEHPVDVSDQMEERDRHRYELDPSSSDRPDRRTIPHGDQ